MNCIPTPIGYLFYVPQLFLHKKSCIEALPTIGGFNDIDRRNCIVVVQMDVSAPEIVGLLLES